MNIINNIIERTLNSAGDGASKPIAAHEEDPILTALLRGSYITRDMALNIPVVSSSVRKISDIVATVPFKLYHKEKLTDGKYSVSEVKDDYRLDLINRDPKDTLNAVELKKAMIADYLLGSGGYAYIGRKTGMIDSIKYVKDGQVSFLSGADPIRKTYSVSIGGVRYEDYEVMRILRSTRNGYSSKSILDEINKALEAAFSALCYQLRLTKTGGVKKGFILAEKKLEGEALRKLKENWQRMYSTDTENVVILNNNLKFQEASQTPMDMQLANTRTTLNKDIREAFGIEDKKEDLIDFTIRPILAEFESALDRYLLLEAEKSSYYWKADTRTIDKDADERISKIATINEQRYREGLPEGEGLDIIPMNLGTTFFDMRSSQFYTPNTGLTGSASSSKGGED